MRTTDTSQRSGLIYPTARVPVGYRVKISDTPHRFKLRFDNTLVFENEITGTAAALTNDQFWQQLYGGVIREDRDPALEGPMAGREDLADAHLLAVSERHRTKYERDLSYAKALMAAPWGSRSGERAKQIITDTARSLGDSNPPSLRKVQKDVQLLKTSGNDGRFIMSKASVKHRRPLRIPDPVVQLMLECLQKHYLYISGPSLQSAYERFLASLADYNEQHPSLARKTSPSYTTFARVLERHFDDYQILAYRHGEKYAERQLRIKEPGLKAERPLEITFTDATPCNLLVVDDSGRVHERLTLTLVIDLFSRAIVGFHLGFEAESWAGYGQAMRNAMSPKKYLGILYPDLADQWPVCGRIETIVSDSTKALMNASFASACAHLGVNWEATKKDSPEHKGVVERAFRRIVEQVTDLLPGGSRFNEEEWKLRDPVKEAVLTIEEAREVLTRWFVEIYHHTPHRGLGRRTPMQVWREGVEKHGVRPSPSDEDLAVYLAHKGTAKLQHDGIHHFGLIYSSPDLVFLRNRLDSGVPVDFVYDDQSIDKLYVIDKRRGRVIVAVADKADYACALSLTQHRRVQRDIREVQKIENPTPMQLAAAKQRIFSKYDASITRPGKVRRGVRDLAAQGHRMPYGGSADGSLNLPPRSDFADLTDPMSASGSGLSPDSAAGSLDSPLLSQLHDDAAPAEIEGCDAASAEATAPITGDNPTIGDADGREQPDKDDDAEDLDRFLSESGWGGLSGAPDEPDDT